MTANDKPPDSTKRIEIDIKHLTEGLIKEPNLPLLIGLLGAVHAGAMALAGAAANTPIEPLALEAAANSLHGAANLRRALGILSDQQGNRVIVPTAMMPQRH